MGATTLGLIRLGGICLLLCSCALSSPFNAEEFTLERTKNLLGMLETAEAGRDAGVSPEILTERLAQAEKSLAAHLRSHPDDVEALIISARLSRFQQVLKPIVLKPGQEPPDPKTASALIHEKLDQALVLQPGNAEAHYWKARLYGIRYPAFPEGRLHYVTIDLNRAIRFAREAVKLESGNDVYREALALYLVEDQKPAEAIEVMQSVADKRHPIYLLLNDFGALPIPKTATLSSEDSESFAQQQMERGRFQDYPQLRVRFYIVPMSLVKLEEFYSSYWDGFKLFPMGDTEKVGDGEIRFFEQHFIKERDKLKPTGADSKIPEQPRSGILLAVVEFRNVPLEKRRQTPAGFNMPSGIGDTFCYVYIVNYRPSK